MDPVATTEPVPRTEKGRKGRSAAIQGAGEEICDVKAEGHAWSSEGVEDRNNRCGEKVNEAGSEENQGRLGPDSASNKAIAKRRDFESGAGIGEQRYRRFE